MVDYLLAMGLILLILAGWIFVQQWARKFAAQHPEFGTTKEEGSGCGKGCGCSHNRCKKTSLDDIKPPPFKATETIAFNHRVITVIRK